MTCVAPVELHIEVSERRKLPTQLEPLSLGVQCIDNLTQKQYQMMILLFTVRFFLSTMRTFVKKHFCQ